MCIRDSTSFVLGGVSKCQTCVSHSTPEAEIVAFDMAVRSEGLPALDFWETVLQRKVRMRALEDNQATMRIIQTGKNPALRHLNRTHRVSVSWLHERCARGDFELEYCDTDEQCADIFTKSFVNAVKWDAVVSLINHYPNSRITRKSDPKPCLLYTSPSPRDLSTSRMPSSA